MVLSFYRLLIKKHSKDEEFLSFWLLTRFEVVLTRFF